MEYYDVILVSEERVKKYGGIDQNVRMELITNNILNAQDLYIQPIIGTLMYNHLKEAIKNNTLNNDEEVLLQDYISKALIYYSLYMLYPYIKYKIVDKGILNGSSEETTATNLDELRYLRQDALNTAEFFTKRLVEYLKDNPGIFTQYENPGVKGLLPDKSSPYFSGLVTTIRKGYKGKYYCDPFYGPSSYTNNNEN